MSQNTAYDAKILVSHVVFFFTGLFGRLVLTIFNAQLTVSKEKGGGKERGEKPEAVAKHGTGMWNGKRERKRKGEKERMKERE